MVRSTFFKIFIITSLLTIMFCNKDSGVQPGPLLYGSISGKILHPDNNLIISVISEDGIDTVTRNPASQMFFFDSIKCGNCILKVRATGYGLFEMPMVLDKPLYICHDIILAKFPPQINSIYPSNSQYLDSLYFNGTSPSITDSGFWVDINFGFRMDTTSVNNVLTIAPDTVGVQTTWSVDQRSFGVFFYYRKLSRTDTVKVTIGSKAINEWLDTLNFPCTVFYPVDTNFIRTNRLKLK